MVVELVYTCVSEAHSARIEGSNPSRRTKQATRKMQKDMP